jgi:hypothetical protein
MRTLLISLVGCSLLVVGVRPAQAAILASPALGPLALSRPLGTVREVHYTSRTGQTIAVRVFATTPEQQPQADRLVARLQARALQEAPTRAGENPSPDGYLPFAPEEVDGAQVSTIDWACAMVGGFAQVQGYVNVYFDAIGALCISFVIVDQTQKWFDGFYAAYLVSAMLRPNPGRSLIRTLFAIPGYGTY